MSPLRSRMMFNIMSHTVFHLASHVMPNLLAYPMSHNASHLMPPLTHRERPRSTKLRPPQPGHLVASSPVLAFTWACISTSPGAPAPFVSADSPAGDRRHSVRQPRTPRRRSITCWWSPSVRQGGIIVCAFRPTLRRFPFPPRGDNITRKWKPRGDVCGGCRFVCRW